MLSRLNPIFILVCLAAVIAGCDQQGAGLSFTIDDYGSGTAILSNTTQIKSKVDFLLSKGEALEHVSLRSLLLDDSMLTEFEQLQYLYDLDLANSRIIGDNFRLTNVTLLNLEGAGFDFKISNCFPNVKNLCISKDQDLEGILDEVRRLGEIHHLNVAGVESISDRELALLLNLPITHLSISQTRLTLTSPAIITLSSSYKVGVDGKWIGLGSKKPDKTTVPGTKNETDAVKTEVKTPE